MKTKIFTSKVKSVFNRLLNGKTNSMTIMRRLLTLFVSLFFLVTVHAQNLSPTIVSVQGGNDLSDYVSLEWSLGENSIETIFSRGNIYTQGFLQTFLVSTGFPTEEQEFLQDQSLLLFPNPVHSKLYIRNNEGWSEKVNVILCDLDQRIVSESTILPGEITASINVSDFPHGVYILRLFSRDGQFIGSYKIVKY
jgi:hypothetical protein